jgi:hypothetical protein
VLIIPHTAVTPGIGTITVWQTWPLVPGAMTCLRVWLWWFRR